MRWVKLIWTSIVVGGGMIGTLMLFSTISRHATGLAAILMSIVSAAAAHQLSGVIIILVAPVYKPSFPPRWHQLWPAERDGRIYQRLGVPAYQKWLLASPFQRSAPPLHIAGKSSLADFDQFTRQAELGHGLLLLISLPVVGWLAMEQEWAIAIWMALINVPWNIYPILLQRSNRARLARLEHRFPRVALH